MAWNTIDQRNDGQTFGGPNFDEARDAIFQLQDTLGPDENVFMPRRLAEVTPTLGSTSFAFPTHPDTFTHLVVEGMVSHDNASAANTVRALALRFNGDSGANYHSLYTAILQTGSVFTADTSGGAATTARFGSIGSLRGTFRLFIPHYRLTTSTRLCQSNGVAASTGVPGSSWRTDSGMTRYIGSDPITQISVFIVGGAGDAFGSNGQVSLYGLP